ncbi:hypothetical protein, partial [Burkholderia gladioli]|uniref:hypothetical protein n=1 Tax=Burkholderia gladioli TaxID=28095 RepID=UPI001CC81DB0
GRQGPRSIAIRILSKVTASGSVGRLTKCCRFRQVSGVGLLCIFLSRGMPARFWKNTTGILYEHN